ncbi:hypothetical protein [Flavihumibacter sp.]|uniref:hypothetical protein n=1 Tax=Flavihumibacter sp. TaxID=1913981 RepID=UPI002FC800D2
MKKNLNTIVVIAVIIGVVGLIIKNITDSNRINDKGVYVIGNIEKIGPGSGGQRVYVSYKFRGEIYNIDYLNPNWQDNKAIVGKYFFKIDPTNPKSIDIVFDKFVPDSLNESPSEGWDSIPIY